jgi:hypothetical protein
MYLPGISWVVVETHVQDLDWVACIVYDHHVLIPWQMSVHHAGSLRASRVVRVSHPPTTHPMVDGRRPRQASRVRCHVVSRVIDCRRTSLAPDRSHFVARNCACTRRGVVVVSTRMVVQILLLDYDVSTSIDKRRTLIPNWTTYKSVGTTRVLWDNPWCCAYAHHPSAIAKWNVTHTQ